MKTRTLRQIANFALQSYNELWEKARAYGRDVKIYLHWTGMHYGQLFEDYHINIDEDGTIYTSTDDFAEVPGNGHTWKRNSGAIGICLCCGICAGGYDLGKEPPTKAQIETMAKVVAVLCTALNIPCDKQHVLTHGEAANNEDGLRPHPAYAWWNDEEGDGDTRGDLEYLGTDESPEYNPYAEDGSRGGDVLRGKANWYIAQDA